jgi:signal transduction histidine kinase
MELKSIQAKSGVDLTNSGESLANIKKAAERISKLVSHLVGFCRSTEAEQKPVDLIQVFEDGLFMIANKLNKSSVKVTRKLPDGPCLVHGDGNELEQVFMNLFSNACDAMCGQEAVAELVIELTATDSAKLGKVWECQVSDTGCGMPQEVAEQIFNSFFTTKEKGKGTGLGLSIARGIVQRHKGEIKVSSTVGAGTVFTVTLPKLNQEAE